MAVVVAHDRHELLAHTLDGLLGQDRPCDRVVVVDNASTDDSGVVAADHPLAPDVLTLTRNTGGAGGFAAGIAHAVQAHHADLVWLMDDDTVPTASALAELLRARDAYTGRPALLASRAVWHDGRDHPMNTPRRRFGLAGPLVSRAAAAGAVPVRSASFVSVLLDAGVVRRVGLPEAAYFLWNDDFEYTSRILRRRVGLWIPDSVVEHRTRTFGSTDADPGDRFFFEVRNKLWMLRTSPALGPVDLALYGASTLVRWARTVLRSTDRRTLLDAGRRGLVAGLRTTPETTSSVLAGLGPVSDEVRAVAKGATRG
ncbi:glycosyltransferase [Georgenia halophila]|uniref:Glycosyltransferase n=1 Tax=Georgenia halophila TaxID=620889 RepID=A0ABP8L3M5_9MICO